MKGITRNPLISGHTPNSSGEFPTQQGYKEQNGYASTATESVSPEVNNSYPPAIAAMGKIGLMTIQNLASLLQIIRAYMENFTTTRTTRLLTRSVQNVTEMIFPVRGIRGHRRACYVMKRTGIDNSREKIRGFSQNFNESELADREKKP